MPRSSQLRTRAVTAAQVRSYVAKAEEYLAAAKSELNEGRSVAATSLAIHAAINAADVVTGIRLGRRAAGQGHEEVLSLLGEAGHDGAEVAKDFGRLLSLKTKTEYEPDDVPKATAAKAVQRAEHCVRVARRVVRAQAG